MRKQQFTPVTFTPIAQFLIKLWHELILRIIAMIFEGCGVSARHFTLRGSGLLKADVWMRDLRIGKARDRGFCLHLTFGNIFDYPKVQCLAETGRNTGGLEADFKPVYTHITFADLTLLRIQLGCVIRADPGANNLLRR